MPNNFLVSVGCVMQDLKLKDDLDAALARYNDLFIPGSSKRLNLVPDE